MNCIHCGKEIAENSTFCSVCGAKQVKTYKEEFVRGSLSEREFRHNINKWFQWHPKVTNVTVHFETGTGFGLFVNQTRLNKFVIEYELSEEDTPYQYGVVRKAQVGLLPSSIKRYVARWQKRYPQLEVLNWAGGSNARGNAASILLGGIGAVNKMTVFMLVRFNRNQTFELPLGLKDVVTKTVCPSCGEKIVAQSAFCPQCGNKLNG